MFTSKSHSASTPSAKEHFKAETRICWGLQNAMGMEESHLYHALCTRPSLLSRDHIPPLVNQLPKLLAPSQIAAAAATAAAAAGSSDPDAAAAAGTAESVAAVEAGAPAAERSTAQRIVEDEQGEEQGEEAEDWGFDSSPGRPAPKSAHRVLRGDGGNGHGSAAAVVAVPDWMALSAVHCLQVRELTWMLTIVLAM